MRKSLFFSVIILLFCTVFTLFGCYSSDEDGQTGNSSQEKPSLSELTPETSLPGVPDEPTTETSYEKEIPTVNIYCGNNRLQMELADNPSANAFLGKLKERDVTVTMHDYGDFEKVGELGFSLVQSNSPVTTAPGDVILYLGNNITIYYDTNSWNFTRLGKINGMTRESMLAFFGGKGEVNVRFSLK